MRYKAVVSYDGSKYYGWQTQLHGKSIQQHIESIIKIKFDTAIKLVASGRTDTGVHATGQVVHFDFDLDVEPQRLMNAINASLNKDIHIESMEKVSDEFHARFNVKSKEYWYTINVGQYDSSMANRQLQICEELDLEAMKDACKVFIGEHDFVSFSSDPREDTVRTITSFEIVKEQDIIIFKVKGDGFLNHMIRHLVGCLIAIGKGKIKKDYITKQLNNPKKGQNYHKVTSEGLCLRQVNY